MSRITTRRLVLQTLAGEPQGRIAPLADLVNVFEVLEMAKRKLPQNVYATISGGDRRALERITFRPRLMVNVTKLNLSVELLGETMFAPLLVGPIAGQGAFHPEGELALVKGASAAKTTVIISSRSSRPLPELVAEAKIPLWFQLYPDSDVQAARKAVDAGCKAVCLTIGVPHQGANWSMIDAIRQKVKAPLVLKGIMSPEEAQTAVTRGVNAIVVSNHGATGFADPIEVLPSIADAVGGKIPVLIDGSFRRGTDILKALALGARAVLLARPPVWGLAAYGAAGVQGVLEMLQSELARSMALCGKPDLQSIDRSLVKIHKR